LNDEHAGIPGIYDKNKLNFQGEKGTLVDEPKQVYQFVPVLSSVADPNYFYTMMRFWIQLFNLMPIRIRLPNIVLIHPDPDPQP
jgi:hypothetical protein